MSIANAREITFPKRRKKQRKSHQRKKKWVLRKIRIENASLTIPKREIAFFF